MGSATVELLVCFAAFVAFLAVLAAASSGFAARAESFSSGVSDSAAAGMLAFELDVRASDSRLSAFNKAELRGCTLSAEGVLCGDASAPTIADNSGGGRFGYYGSVPG